MYKYFFLLTFLVFIISGCDFSLASTETNQSVISNNIRDNKTSDWNSYTNKKFGFTIKYPKSAFKEKETNHDKWVYQEMGNNIFFNSSVNEPADYSWGIHIHNNEDLEVLIKKIGGEFNNKKENRKNITIGETPAVLVEVSIDQNTEWLAKIVFIKKDNMIYAISNGYRDHPQFEEFYKNFKFIE